MGIFREFLNEIRDPSGIDVQHAIRTRDIGGIRDLVDGASKDEFKRIEAGVIRSGSPVLITEFAQHIKGANIKKLQAAIIGIQDARMLVVFAQEVKGANIKKLQDELLKIDCSMYVRRFAQTIKSSELHALWKQMKKLGATDETFTFFINDNCGKTMKGYIQARKGWNNKRSTDFGYRA